MENQTSIANSEELISMYKQTIQDQTGIIFSLVGKLGGKVNLSKEDLLAYPKYNTVAARTDEEGGLILELTRED